MSAEDMQPALFTLWEHSAKGFLPIIDAEITHFHSDLPHQWRAIKHTRYVVFEQGDEHVGNSPRQAIKTEAELFEIES